MDKLLIQKGDSAILFLMLDDPALHMYRLGVLQVVIYNKLDQRLPGNSQARDFLVHHKENCHERQGLSRRFRPPL
jgi:hypothetical protein